MTGLYFCFAKKKHNQHDALIPPVSAPGRAIDDQIVNQVFSTAHTVYLDSSGMYRGQSTCNICSNQLQGESMILSYPCGHVFHSNCLYQFAVIEGNQSCNACHEHS